MKTSLLAAATLLAVTAAAQRPQASRPLSPTDRPDIQTLARNVQGLRQSAQLDAANAARADQLLREATSLLGENQTGEARWRFAKAQAIVVNQPWEAKDDFAWSLALRPRNIAMDTALPQIADIAQLYSAAYKPAGPLRVHMALTTIGAEPKPVRDLGVFELASRDLAAEPFPIALDLKGTPDGSYRLNARIMDGSDALVTLQHTIAIADGIDVRAADTHRRLERIQGHDSAKLSVRWPFDMARVLNLGIRKLESLDFGLPESGGQVFDFAKELRESAELLKALESGKDPLVRAKGDHERHYWLEEAGEIMPYRVYVPSTWDGKRQLPMIFVMHGNTRDHNFYFDRDGGLLAKLAEKNGYIVATTMGYRPSAGYNASAIAPRRDNNAAPSVRAAAMQRETELSEKDAMHALDLVVKEFNPDPKRIYLFGHSAGATGGWYIGSKYADRFAGLALSAFTTQPAVVPFDKLKGIPILVIVGSKDTPRTVETARAMAKAVAEKSFDTQFLEIPEATHDTIVGLALPTAFQFFDKRGRK